jgi:hypothetical protein
VLCGSFQPHGPLMCYFVLFFFLGGGWGGGSGGGGPPPPPQALQQVNQLAVEGRRSLGPESEVQYEMLRALQELGQAGKALQRTMEGLDQQPQSLIFGKSR